MRSQRPLVLFAATALLLWTACGDAGDGRATAGGAQRAGEGPRNPAPDGNDPPTARRAMLEELRFSHEAERSPADGGGRAWIEWDADEPRSIGAGGHGTWTILFEAGPDGVAVGGSVRLLVSPHWEWSPAQTRDANRPGFTTAECLAEGVRLDVSTPGWLNMTIRDRALAEGEQLRIVYGAGDAGARTDKYAEEGARLWIAVDGDGDGIHSVLADSPSIQVTPGPPARVQLLWPGSARPGETVDLHVSVLDAFGSTGIPFEGELELIAVGEAIELPATVAFEAGDLGRRTVQVTLGQDGSGVQRVGVHGHLPGPAGEREIVAESNPLLLGSSNPRLLWADLHGHSNLSDGTGTTEQYFTYARDVAGLDVVALTDHDHWGMLHLDEHPALWDEIQAATKAYHDPGRFVTILGFEWTSWIHGHRHVLYFGDEGPVLSSIDPAFETPAQLWAGLRETGLRSLTFAHHSAGGPVATNWDYAPDPEFEPVTEVVSVHGNSEALDGPVPIYSPLRGNFVRDILGRGFQLGFIGSGDSHDGHPGLAHLASPTQGGLAAILSEDKTREGVYEALVSRRVYATNGPRIVLQVALNKNRMGAIIPAEELGADGPATLFVRAIGTAPLQRIAVIRSGEVVERIDCDEAWDFSTAFELADLKPGEFVYVRVVQVDRGAAWSSPFYLE